MTLANYHFKPYKLFRMKYILLILSLLFVSCKDKVSQKDEYIKELEEKNKQLSSNQSTTVTTVDTSRSFNYPPPQSLPSEQYNTVFAFVVINVQLQYLSARPDEQYEYKNMIFTTGIQEYTNLNEDIKFQILDKAQRDFNNSSSGVMYNGIVKKRKLYTYSTYAAASRAKEKFTISETNN